MITDYPIILEGSLPYDLGAHILHAYYSSILPLAIGDATGPKRIPKEGASEEEQEHYDARRAYNREWMRAKRGR